MLSERKRSADVTSSPNSLLKITSKNTQQQQRLEVIVNRFYWQVSQFTQQGNQAENRFCTDSDYVYTPFYKDYGPLHIGMIHHYILTIDRMLSQEGTKGKILIHYSSSDITKKTNSAFLVGCYMVIRFNIQPKEVWRQFKQFEPYRPYRDPANSTIYEQSMLECWQGLKKAFDYGWYTPDSFDSKSYNHYSKGEVGNLNIIVPNRFIAMSGPYFARVDLKGGRRNIVEDYFEPFKQLGVTTIVRLNMKDYDEKKFMFQGLRHLDYYFPDGTAPRKELVQRFLNQIENIDGCIAVYCHAGLGRTATMIGAYVIKHFKFTAPEFIGWVRICRPGSVHGPQQTLLLEIEDDLMQERNIQGRSAFSLGKPKTPNNYVLPPSIHLQKTKPNQQSKPQLQIQIQPQNNYQTGQNRLHSLYAALTCKGEQIPRNKNLFLQDDFHRIIQTPSQLTQPQTPYQSMQPLTLRVSPQTPQERNIPMSSENENQQGRIGFQKRDAKSISSAPNNANSTLLSFGNEASWSLLPQLRQKQINLRDAQTSDRQRRGFSSVKINSLFNAPLKQQNA